MSDQPTEPPTCEDEGCNEPAVVTRFHASRCRKHIEARFSDPYNNYDEDELTQGTCSSCGYEGTLVIYDDDKAMCSMCD